MTSSTLRTRLMACDATGRWIWGSSIHTLDQVRALIQPGERVYLVTWDPDRRTSPSVSHPLGKIEEPKLKLVNGPLVKRHPRLPPRPEPYPSLGIDRARRSFGIVPDRDEDSCLSAIIDRATKNERQLQLGRASKARRLARDRDRG